MREGLRLAIIGAGAAAAVAATVATASAGGFAVREQSAEYQGMSFAGNAAGGGGLSAMFWNPAAVGQFNGIRTESHYAYIRPDSEITALPGSTLLFNGASSGNVGNEALVGSSYLSYQLSPHLVFGFSFNAPFGLSSEPENRVWAGMTHARTSDIKTYNGQAVLAYRVNPQLIVAAGLMVEHIDGRLKQASDILATSQNVVVHGDDTAFGFTAGVIYNPSSTTSLGLGFRSSIDHTLEGEINLAGPTGLLPGAGPGGWGSASIRAGITLPEIVTASIRQAVSPNLTILGSIEWTNWSRVQKLDIVCTSASVFVNVLGCPGPGAVASSLPLGWHDGWFFALGAEYAYSPALILRGGLAYEISPIQAADERTPRVPDSDRIWASLGLTYNWSQTMSFDLAYTHIFMDGGDIDRTASGVRLLATVDSQIDIIAASVKMRFGGGPEPLK